MKRTIRIAELTPLKSKNSGEPVGEERAGISVRELRGRGIGGNSRRNKSRKRSKRNGEEKSQSLVVLDLRCASLS